MFRTLLPYLEAADVVLADRYHCNYFTVALLVERGVDLVTRQHQRRITDFRRGKRMGPRNRLVQWQRPQRPSWMDVQTYARMPESLTLRQAEVAGRILVTTLTDARTVSVQEVDALYRRRWQVEVDLRSIKAEMGMAVVRAQSPAMADKEIGVYLLAYNLVCALMTRAGAAARVLARALSFKGTLQLLLAFQQHLRLSGGRSATTMTAHLIGQSACSSCRYVRTESSRTPSNEDRKTITCSRFRVPSPARKSAPPEQRRPKVVPWGSDPN